MHASKLGYINVVWEQELPDWFIKSQLVERVMSNLLNSFYFKSLFFNWILCCICNDISKDIHYIFAFISYFCNQRWRAREVGNEEEKGETIALFCHCFIRSVTSLGILFERSKIWDLNDFVCWHSGILGKWSLTHWWINPIDSFFGNWSA